ncbi:zinc ribbon domain-containing protein [Tahibacter amnicola]|uniref:Zinc ribbon domain-containing protein n=1 Tax=Tahibacter amnicola TaxID=2976241 RepID=A0ABY6BJA7_9GAMM|nr:zinc ribbon domain-containing protein [Tahibacter amnicola]UXI67917.1 zinc ribbon domain-containing protein [Tahibacter amnicola]
MSHSHTCQSCGMPIESGAYCHYCVDESGQLQAFDERFERMVQWVLGREPTTPRAIAEARTREYMRQMPAWKDHPRLQA